MNKITISLLALAALSTASFAGSGSPSGKLDNQEAPVLMQGETYSTQNAFAAPGESTGQLSALERWKKSFEENTISDK